MGRVIVEILSSSGLKRDLTVFDKACVRVGRGYDNDIILQDPYAAAAQCVIYISEDGVISVEDTGEGGNGVFFSEARGRKRHRVTGRADIVSASVLYLGQTVLRVFSPNHPVAPVRSFQSDKRTDLSVFKKVSLTWYAIIGFFIIVIAEGILHFQTNEIQLGSLFFLGLVMMLVLSAWSGGWALLGRLLGNHARFRVHITMVCFYAVICLALGNICKYVGAVCMDPLAEGLCDVVLLGGSFAFLLFGHLTYTTRLSHSARVITAVAVPLVFCALAAAGVAVNEKAFSPYPPYYAGIQPPIVRPLKVSSIDDYVEDIGKVFQDAREKK